MIGKTGALLLYAASTSVNWYTLKSNHLKRVAGNLNQAIGVGYDGNHIYWTNILVGAESIMKARMDGSEVMVRPNHRKLTSEIVSYPLFLFESLQ